MYSHTPILLDQIISALNLKEDSIAVDLTLGRAGHASEILKRIPHGHLYAFDQDIDAICQSRSRLEEIGTNFTLIHDNFTTLLDNLTFLNVKQVDAIIMDLGVSSPQLDAGERGFSYRYDSRLDMRMDQTRNFLTAEIVVNTYSLQRLSKIFKEYGESKFAYKIAKNIIKAREEKTIETTFELVEIIKKSLPAKELNKKGHPAKTIFQAIRIEVNDELNKLKTSLTQALQILANDGILAVLTFHSLEDRIVKNIFKDKTVKVVTRRTPMLMPSKDDGLEYELVNRKVIIADEEEIINNPRSTSAKLRIIKRKRGNEK